MDKKEISYEIIDYSGVTNVKFYTSTDNGSYIPSHWHRAVEILYMQEGALDVTIENTSFTIHPGDCILINANVIHSTKCTVPNKAIVLQVPVDFMEKYIPNVQQFMFIWDHHTKDPVKRTKLEMLKTTLEQLQIIDDIRPDGFILRFNSLIFELLFQLYHNFRVRIFHSDLSQQKKDLDRLNFVLNYIAENYQRPISLDEIAGVAYLQTGYFCRFFKKKNGSYFSGISERIPAFFYLQGSYKHQRPCSHNTGTAWFHQLQAVSTNVSGTFRMYAYQGTEKHSERQGLTGQRSYFRLTKNLPGAYLTDSRKIFYLKYSKFLSIL